MNNKKELFEEYPVGKALAVMAVPTIISQLITLIYNLADTWYIGQTNNPYMVGACSLCLTVFMITIAIANLFGVGGGTLVSRMLGVKDEAEAETVAAVSFWMALGSAIVYSALCLVFMDPLLRLLGASDNTIGYARQYMVFVIVIGGSFTVMSQTMSSIIRSLGYSRAASAGLMLGGIMNIILDPLFMFVILPDGMQVMGAAIATMLSNMISCSFFLFMYWRFSRKGIRLIRIRQMRPRKSSISQIFSVGIPAALGVLLFDLTNIVIYRLSAGHGDIELAAIGIVLKAERLPLNTGVGLCLGMAPLIAYNYAAQNYKRMQSVFNVARAVGVGFAILCVVLYRGFAGEIMAAFIKDEGTVRYGTEFLKARCFATPLMFLCFSMVNFMQAIGSGRVSFWLAVLRQIVFNIPMLLVLDRLFGMNGIIWTQAVADFCTVVLSYVVYLRMKKGWMSAGRGDPLAL